MIKSKSAHALSILNQCAMALTLSVFVCLILTASEHSADERLTLLACCTVCPAVLFSYLLCQKTDSLPLYLGGHALMCAFFLFCLPTAAIAVGYTNTVILIIIMLVHIRESARPEQLPLLAPQPADELLFLIIYCMNRFTVRISIINSLCLYCCAASVIFICLFRYRCRMDDFVETHKKDAGYHFPLAQIQRNSRMLICIFLLLTVVLMFLIPMSGLQTLTNLLQNGLVGLLVLLVRLLGLGQNGAEGEGSLSMEEILTEESIEYSQTATRTAELPYWLNMTIYIFFTIVVICALAALTGFIVYALYCFFRSFAGIPLSEEEAPDYVERAQSVAPKRSLRFRREDVSTPSAVVRKLYRHVIRTHKKKNVGIPSSSTPSEVETIAALSDNADAKLLHDLYEKARYSKDGATKADAEQVRSVARKKL